MMNEKTKIKLETFAHLNNWSLSHPLDMERFWEFVIEAYNNGDTIDEESFCTVIKPFYKLDEKESNKWFFRYENGIELLGVYHKSLS